MSDFGSFPAQSRLLGHQSVQLRLVPARLGGLDQGRELARPLPRLVLDELPQLAADRLVGDLRHAGGAELRHQGAGVRVGAAREQCRREAGLAFAMAASLLVMGRLIEVVTPVYLSLMAVLGLQQMALAAWLIVRGLDTDRQVQAIRA